MRKTIVITGGAGFLGSHLCDRFIQEGYKVVAFDNLCTGNMENLKSLQHEMCFDFEMRDVSDGNLRVSGNIDYFIHAASPASPMDYLKLPIETLRVGSVGTYNCLELARLTGARILVVSTSEVYGDPFQHPQKETYWGNVNSIGLRSCYDEAKRYMEALTMAYSRTYKTNTAIVRLFNSYGERMKVNDGRAVPSFFQKAMANEDVEVFGDGSQTRSLCYVDDTVEGILKLLLSDYHDPVNIGNPDPITMKDLADEIIELTNSQSKIIFKPLPEDDPKQREPNIDLAKAILGWQPKITRETGLEKTYNYFKTKING